MKIAITGGAGFIGSHLTRAYLDAGHNVVVLDSLFSGSERLIDPRARFYRIDIRDGQLRTILQRERPDIVSHHVALQRQSIPHEQILADADVHVRGLLNVLDSCVAASVKQIIFASGGNTMYGQLDPELPPLTEETPLCPRTPHDISKVGSEWYVRYYSQHYGLQHTILRYADVYGETDTTRLLHPLSMFIHMLKQHRRPLIREAADEIRDHIFIDDVVQANLSLLRHLKAATHQTINISSGRGHSFSQLYELLTQSLGSKITPAYFSESLMKICATLDNTRARQLLNWQPVFSLSDGISHAITRLGSQNVQPTTGQLVEPALSSKPPKPQTNLPPVYEPILATVQVQSQI